MKKILLAIAALLLISGVGVSQVPVTRKKKQEATEQTAAPKPKPTAKPKHKAKQSSGESAVASTNQPSTEEVYRRGYEAFADKNYPEAECHSYL